MYIDPGLSFCWELKTMSFRVFYVKVIECLTQTGLIWNKLLSYKILRGRTNFKAGWSCDLTASSRTQVLSISLHHHLCCCVHPQKERSSILLSLSWENLSQNPSLPTLLYPLVLELSHMPVPLLTRERKWPWPTWTNHLCSSRYWGLIYNVHYLGTGKKVAKVRTTGSMLDREWSGGRRVLRGRK